jgi:hypothetical protein
MTNTEVASIKQVDNNSPFVLTDNGSGNYVITATGKSVLKKGTTYTVKCQVMSEDQAVNTNPVIWQIKVKVK